MLNTLVPGAAEGASYGLDEMQYDIDGTHKLLGIAKSILVEMDYGPPGSRNIALERVNLLVGIAHEMIERAAINVCGE